MSHLFGVGGGQAYDNTGPDPFGLLKQAGQCLNQQHYLDPKYHGAGHGLVRVPLLRVPELQQ